MPAGRLEVLLFQTTIRDNGKKNNKVAQDDAKNGLVGGNGDTSDVCAAMVATGMAEFASTYPRELTKHKKRDTGGREVHTVLSGTGNVLKGSMLPG